MNTTSVKQHVKRLLSGLEIPVKPDILAETPGRVADFYQEVLSGYAEDPVTHAKTFPNEGGRELMVIKSIHFYSLCEHHMVPFFGEVAIGYIPDKRILGLSKFVRITEVFSRRLQLQERLTKQICDAVEQILQPEGCGVRIQAKHLCMTMRGVRSENPCVTTMSFAGTLKAHKNVREEFLSHFKS
jgi:GTP cyclohydrolase I